MVTSSDMILFRGNDATFQLTVKKIDGSAYSLALCTLTLYVKRKETEKNSDAVLTKTTGDGISVGDITGIVIITILDTDTTNLEVDINFVYDIELETPAGLKFTILRGAFRLRQN